MPGTSHGHAALNDTQMNGKGLDLRAAVGCPCKTLAKTLALHLNPNPSCKPRWEARAWTCWLAALVT